MDVYRIVKLAGLAPYHTGGSVIIYSQYYVPGNPGNNIIIFLVGLKLLKTNHFFNNYYKHTYR